MVGLVVSVTSFGKGDGVERCCRGRELRGVMRCWKVFASKDFIMFSWLGFGSVTRGLIVDLYEAHRLVLDNMIGEITGLEVHTLHNRGSIGALILS